MQATLDSTGLKHLTRALTCLSKFGDDLAIVATSETFALSATNTAMTAYGRFKYPRSFFSRYRVETRPVGEDIEELPNVSGQIVIKHLLSIFKHKNNEKACEKCEFVITDGPTQTIAIEDEDEERDSLESRLTVRLHCKHGVVKTHRLSLNPMNDHLSPAMPDPTLETSLTVGPKTMKNILEHFPFGKGNKTDPQLIWNFHDDEVVLRSLETSVDGKGRPQLVTELTLGATEFDTYDLAVGPVTIAFHLREFNATIAFAEASEVSLNLRFTDPLEPLYISVDADYADTLFVIATSQIVSRSQQASQADPTPRNPRKRPLEEDRNHNQPQQRNVRIAEGALRERPRVPAKPMKVVRKTDRQSMAREMHPPPLPTAEPQPSWAKEREKEPLFLPSSQISHLPPASQAAIIESGLGIEHMTAEELAMMLDDDVDLDEFGGDADVDADTGGRSGGHDRGYADEDWRMEDREDFLTGEKGQGGTDSFELVDDEDFEMAPTQSDGGTKVWLHFASGVLVEFRADPMSSQSFRPLFRD
ncbi:Rad9-domain-containing protein [Dichomitus squalens]|uniref:Rad9-domain-containing protein n=1 Tax=Dichomitus squalens TaxID=114155 RepID=A0A4Q9Q0Q3_9APHY|nr:Rad9-domain-containing protein [Dichomitus squalens]